jgi:hypothetical protein
LGGSAHIGAGLQELEHAVDLAVHRREHQRSLDASRPLDPDQRPLLRAFADAIVVANKWDRRADAWTGEVSGALPVVATTGRGVDELRRSIRGRFDCEDLGPTRPRWWTSRQRDVLIGAQRDVAGLAEIGAPGLQLPSSRAQRGI